MNCQSTTFEDEPIVIGKFVMDLLLKQKNFHNLFAMYGFYYYTARWQKTDTPKVTNNYVAKGMGWGEDKVKETKKQLIELGLIENVTTKQEGHIKGHFILVKYVWTKKRTDKNTNQLLFSGGNPDNYEEKIMRGWKIPQGVENSPPHRVENSPPHRVENSPPNALDLDSSLLDSIYRLLLEYKVKVENTKEKESIPQEKESIPQTTRKAYPKDMLKNIQEELALKERNKFLNTFPDKFKQDPEFRKLWLIFEKEQEATGKALWYGRVGQIRNNLIQFSLSEVIEALETSIRRGYRDIFPQRGKVTYLPERDGIQQQTSQYAQVRVNQRSNLEW